jgi:hypothetical protein
MSTKILITTLALMCCISTAALAGEGRARIDVYANSPLKIEAATDKKVRVSNPGWVKDEAKKQMSLTADLYVPDDQWKQISISFTPETDGYGSLQLKGQWDKTNKNLAYFDDVQVEGTTLKNGGFEEKDGWKIGKDVLVSDETLAHTGKAAVHVWHDTSISQSVKLTAGQKVTITAWVKFDKQEPKETK